MAKITRTCFCYRVVRFFRVSGRRKIISVGLTRSQAMAHCSRPDTSRAGVWFDGFEMMPGYADFTVAGVLPGAGDPAPDPAPASVPAVDPVRLPVPVAGAPDPALVYTRWQPGPAVRGLPALDEDEGDLYD